jgi:hypothetical protein
VKLALEIMGVCAFSEFVELKLTPATLRVMSHVTCLITIFWMEDSSQMR